MAAGIVTIIQSGPPASALRDTVGGLILDTTGELILDTT